VGKLELAIARLEDDPVGSAGGLTLIVALPCLVRLTLLVAVRRIDVVELTFGAVNRPLAVTVPAEADHATAESSALETTAANCLDEPEEIFALAGETTTFTGGDTTRERLTVIEMIFSP